MYFAKSTDALAMVSKFLTVMIGNVFRSRASVGKCHCRLECITDLAPIPLEDFVVSLPVSPDFPALNLHRRVVAFDAVFRADWDDELSQRSADKLLEATRLWHDGAREAQRPWILTQVPGSRINITCSY